MRGCDPESVLLVVAEAETNEFVLRSLCTAISSRMRPEPAIRILETLEQSPHLSKERRQHIRIGMKRIERRRLQEEREQEKKADQ